MAMLNNQMVISFLTHCLTRFTEGFWNIKLLSSSQLTKCQADGPIWSPYVKRDGRVAKADWLAVTSP